MPIDWTTIILALIAWLSAMLTPIITAWLTMRKVSFENAITQSVVAVEAAKVAVVAEQVKAVVKEESAKANVVAEEVKTVLTESTLKADTRRDEAAIKIDDMAKVLEATHTSVNANFQAMKDDKEKAEKDKVEAHEAETKALRQMADLHEEKKPKGYE